MSQVILIIDDDPIICLIHRRFTQKNHLAAEPLVFSNGLAALNYLFNFYHHENDYLILLDINMPVMNGWEFLQEINKQYSVKNLNVFIVSSSIQASDRNKARTLNYVVDFLEKPMKPADIAKINKVLKPGQYNLVPVCS